MLLEVCTIDDIDGAGLVGTDGDGSGIAIETVGIAAHKVARSDGLDGALATLLISDKVMETAALDIAEETGNGSFGLKDVAPLERPPFPVLHAVRPQDLQIQSLLVGVELLVRCHIRQLSDSWVQR